MPTVPQAKNEAIAANPRGPGYLGHLSLVGKIVPKDWDKARTLLTCASVLGDKDAEKQLDWLNSQPKN